MTLFSRASHVKTWQSHVKNSKPGIISHTRDLKLITDSIFICGRDKGAMKPESQPYWRSRKARGIKKTCEPCRGRTRGPRLFNR
jgi:hypothetical protein